MAAASAYAAVVAGTNGHVTRVDVVTQPGPPQLELTGLPQLAVRPTGERVRAAVINSQLPWPGNQITVTLDPTMTPGKDGAFDLAIAMAVLAAGGSLSRDSLRRVAFAGELGLDGRLRPAPAVLPAVSAAAAAGLTTVMVPPTDQPDALLVAGVRILAPPTLADAVLLARQHGITPGRFRGCSARR